MDRPELWISGHEWAVVFLGERGGERIGVGNRKLALQRSGVPEVLACRHFDRCRQRSRRFAPGFGKRPAVALSEEAVDFASVDGAHQKPGLARVGLREKLTDEVACGLSGPRFLSGPRIKDARLHARVRVS